MVYFLKGRYIHFSFIYSGGSIKKCPVKPGIYDKQMRLSRLNSSVFAGSQNRISCFPVRYWHTPPAQRIYISHLIFFGF
jgi:hypothetical protein